MQNVTRSLKVGALLIAASVGSVALYRTLFQPQGSAGNYHVYAIFNDATGLVPRSRVLTAGIAIGEIERISLENGRARVDLRIQTTAPIFRNGTVARRAVSVLGEFLLVVAPGTPDVGRVPDGGRINTVFEGSSTDEIVNNVAQITRDLQRVTERVSRAVGNEDAERDLREILRNVTELTRSVNATVQQNSTVVSHTLQNLDSLTTRGQPDVLATLSNLRESTDRLTQILGRNQPSGDNTVTQMQETLRNVADASRSLRESLDHVNNVAGSIDRGEGNLGRLARDESLIDEVQGTAEALNDVVQPISRLQTMVGLRSEYSFISNTLRSYVELRLQPREDKYFLIEVIDDPRGLTTVSSNITDTTDPTLTPHVRTVSRLTTDSFRFSAMIARRVGPITFRYGIKESSGGFGADLHLLDDRIEVRTDLFGFGENSYPRFRAAAAFNVLQRAWLIAGIDDVFNGDRFDYFLGAQLRFLDDDLKAILPFSGGAFTSAPR
ncbi:MAG: MCE family protein [Myxococcales bacterium]|nr:MCE family protein [Myxococcales bacterium]